VAAEVFPVDEVSRPPAPAPWWSSRRWRAGPAAAAPALPEAALPESAADLLWSNMVLHHLADPRQGMARWLRLLAVDGLLMFSTLGPGTLESLRRLYGARRWPAPHAPFVDMHDLGDMLVEAGFADPVMDQEVLTLTWATPAAALAELRQLGGNADPGRCAGLRTPRWRAALEQALSSSRPDGRVALEFEIVYGHAVRPPPRARVAAETAVPLEDLRGMLRARAPRDSTR
jgi:malonyl-CoA O-methyltransferase